jgi:hypothetical protein
MTLILSDQVAEDRTHTTGKCSRGLHESLLVFPPVSVGQHGGDHLLGSLQLRMCICADIQQQRCDTGDRGGLSREQWKFGGARFVVGLIPFRLILFGCVARSVERYLSGPMPVDDGEDRIGILPRGLGQ